MNKQNYVIPRVAEYYIGMVYLDGAWKVADVIPEKHEPNFPSQATWDAWNTANIKAKEHYGDRLEYPNNPFANGVDTLRPYIREGLLRKVKYVSCAFFVRVPPNTDVASHVEKHFPKYGMGMGTRPSPIYYITPNQADFYIKGVS